MSLKCVLLLAIHHSSSFTKLGAWGDTHFRDSTPHDQSKLMVWEGNKINPLSWVV